MKILIINTGRFGDVIQSSVLIKGLKKKFPESKIYYLVLENFKEAAYLIKEIDFVISIDFSNVLKKIDWNNLKEGFYSLKKIINEVKNIPFDLLINISYSELSGFLSTIIKAKEKRGLIFSNGKMIPNDEWSKFFLSIVDNRKYSPFNIVDIFSQLGKVPTLKWDIISNENLKNIGFQMGASTESRQWPVEYFAELAKIILNKRNSVKIFLFGSKNEEKLGIKFENIFKHPNIINLIGKTTISQLYSKIKDEIDLLVTNDTGTMHLAWFAKKKVIELSLGPALFQTTSPYGEGHYILQPKLDCCPCDYNIKCLNYKCHRYISPLDVYETIFNQNFISDRFYILKTCIDKDNFLSYKCFNFPELTYNLEKLKHLWITIIENKINFSEFYEKTPKQGEINQIIYNLMNIIEKILNEENIQKLYNYIERFDITREILSDYIFSEKPQLIPFLKFYNYSNSDIEDEDIKELFRKIKLNTLKLFFIVNKFY